MCGVPYPQLRRLYCPAHRKGLQGRHLRADGGPRQGQGARQAGCHPRGHARHRHREQHAPGGQEQLHLPASTCKADEAGLCFADVSTGEAARHRARRRRSPELHRTSCAAIRPSEVLLNASAAGLQGDHRLYLKQKHGCAVELVEEEAVFAAGPAPPRCPGSSATRTGPAWTGMARGRPSALAGALLALS